MVLVLVISRSLQNGWNKSFSKLRPWSVRTSNGQLKVVTKCDKNVLAVNYAFLAGKAARSTHFVI